MGTVINISIAVEAAVCAFALLRLCRTRRPAREQCAGARVWDTVAEAWVPLAPGAVPGPGQMTEREIAEADALELLYLAPAYDAELEAGFDRLRQAIRDEQQKGES
jgi:hypothetical protein